ncbi:hypothetical protein AGMMS49992_12250 [Clostridia bacterium]|nr:hypothetical protein AGMMS49992_12250 [Clostridia bacterium]
MADKTISSGDIIDLRNAILAVTEGDTIYITKDLTENLGAYTTIVFYDDLPHFSIIGKPAKAGGRIHIGQDVDGKRMKVALMEGSWQWPVSADIENIELHMEITDPASSVGFIDYGYNCRFYNCVTEGYIKYQDQRGPVSPFIGMAKGAFEMNNCVNNCDLDVPNSDHVGGLAGSVLKLPSDPYQTARFTNCVNNGNITGDAAVGGIVAYFEDYNECYIEDCTNNGDITVTQGQVGGIVSFLSVYEGNKSQIIRCRNNGTIKIPLDIEYFNDFNDMGGIVGYAGSWQSEAKVSIHECVNYGDVFGMTIQNNTGGIAGIIDGNTDIVQCDNYGNIWNGGMLGGIVGFARCSYEDSYALIQRCFNRGSVHGDMYGVGGIAGLIYGNTIVEDCGVCSVVKTIESASEGVGGIVGAVTYTDYLGYDGVSGLTIIRNNVASTEYIKVIHDAASPGDGNDYVHRILGQFLPDQDNPDPPNYPDLNSRLLLENNYAYPPMLLIGDNGSITDGFKHDAFYNHGAGGVYPSPGVTINSKGPDYGADQLNGGDPIDVDPAHPLAPYMLECMYGYIPPIITATLCGFNHGDGVRPGCFTVGLYADDGTTLLAKATNDSKGIMKLPLISPSLSHPGSYCFWVRRVRNSNNHVLNYVESFPVRVWVTQDANGKLNHYVCYSMMLGEPNFLI